jgi:MFS superfamily sulfate permease-like transporter
VAGLIDAPALLRMWRISKLDFYAAIIALGAVLLLGILQGILLAAAASILLLLARVSQPHVAYLGRIPGTSSYSDLARHPENEPLPNLIAFRPEASLLYVNADSVLQEVSDRVRALGTGKIRLVVCDLSASPYIDLAGARMLHQLHNELGSQGINLLLWERAAGCAISSEPRASVRRSAGLTAGERSTSSWKTPAKRQPDGPFLCAPVSFPRRHSLRLHAPSGRELPLPDTRRDVAYWA